MTKAILCINANKAMNYVLQSITNGNYDVISVDDIYTANEKLKRRQDIETIVIDIDNTDDEVLDFIHHIKISRFYNRPIVVLSSDKSENFQYKMNEVKIQHLLFKPFTPGDFLKKIQFQKGLIN